MLLSMQNVPASYVSNTIECQLIVLTLEIVRIIKTWTKRQLNSYAAVEVKYIIKNVYRPWKSHMKLVLPVLSNFSGSS